MFHKCFDLRRKQKGLIHLRIVKRLDSKNIPCTEKSFFLCIPNHKRVHSPETIDKFLSPLLISVYQSFRICIRDKYMSSLDQFFSQFLIVIDFPIENKHHAFIFIIKGLISDWRLVDNAQTPKSKSRILINIFPCTVRSSVYDCIHHIYKNSFPIFYFTDKTCKTTHFSSSFP